MLSRDFGASFRVLSSGLSLLLLLSFSAYAQNGKPDPAYRIRSTAGYVQSKNYPLITLLDAQPAAQQLLKADTMLSGLAHRKATSLAASLKECATDGSCFISRLKFAPEEISQVSARLKQLYKTGNALDKLVKDHLLPSGTYVMYQQLPPADMLAKAWEQEAGAVNWAIDVYGGGQKPNYPQIDSISVNTGLNSPAKAYRPAYVGFLYNTTNVVGLETSSRSSFYSIPLQAALQFLEMNEREQIADYEPMEQGVNKAAFDRAKSVKWSNYKYSLILIPGAGPDDPEEALSAEGMLRCRLAVLQYKQGLAPFLMPSGGKVHPYKTKFNEALEMKKYMMEKLGVPENAIILEPHARHTTTNMRNAVRLMFRYGFPMEKTALAVTTRLQSGMIGSTLTARCQKELNLVPYKFGTRLSETAIEFLPLIEALQVDPDEPMDP